jgi:predicted phosphoribosyltransferase
MKVEELINDKTFMDEFVSFANDVFSHYGGYDDVYEQYDQFSEEEVLTLLDYCEENELLED